MTAKKPFDYQAAQAELDTILADLQRGDLPLDAAIPTYERGIALVDALEAEVKRVETKLTKLRVQLPEA